MAMDEPSIRNSTAACIIQRERQMRCSSSRIAGHSTANCMTIATNHSGVRGEGRPAAAKYGSLRKIYTQLTTNAAAGNASARALSNSEGENRYTSGMVSAMDAKTIGHSRLNRLSTYEPYWKPPRPIARSMLRVLKKPVMTKKTVTPRKPPESMDGRVWNSTTDTIARARNPSMPRYRPPACTDMSSCDWCSLIPA